jgi:hypothetical protein
VLSDGYALQQRTELYARIPPAHHHAADPTREQHLHSSFVTPALICDRNAFLCLDAKVGIKGSDLYDEQNL